MRLTPWGKVGKPPGARRYEDRMGNMLRNPGSTRPCVS
jgi:hypothetical protein